MDTTLLKGLAVLEALARHGTECGITELARELGLTKSNVHRSLQTLVHASYVRRDDTTSRYECTLKMWEFGSAIMQRIDVRPAARPCMETLAARTGESVHLSVLESFEVLYLDKIESAHPVRAYSRVGGRAPPYCVATGKALLAYASDEVLERTFKSMQRFTSRTIADPEALRKELQRVRESGIAFNRGEWREGVVGVAAPILDLRRGAVAAIGISGPVERLNLNMLKELAPLVVKAGRATGQALGLMGGDA